MPPDDPLLARLVGEMRERHRCHTVLLYGSRARGEHRPDSDYDVLGVRDDGPEERDARPWGGAYLDAFVYPAARVEGPDPALLHLRDAVVLCQRDGLADRVIAAARAAFAAGPAPLAPDDAAVRRVWARKTLARARRGDAEGDYRRVWLLMQLLEDYFALRTRWYLGPRESLAWLDANEPEVYARFRAALAPGADLEAIGRLVDAVVGSE